MKALVTGGAGFIGSHLCQRLLARGLEVVSVDNLICGRLKNLDEFKNNPNFNFVQADIRDRKVLLSTMKGIDWVLIARGSCSITKIPAVRKTSSSSV